MTGDSRDRELTLQKVADDVVEGERFRIIRLDGAALANSETPVDAATAEAQLLAFGFGTWEIAQLLADARDAFKGLTGRRSAER